jgi:folylpolyglutamate synthase/dihydrofolate synthase
MEVEADPPILTELLTWCSGLVKGREARRRRVPVLFDAFRDLINDRIPIVTMTGTSGKGSTCALLEAVIAAGGHVPGTYTKPHLISFRERIRVAGRCVSNVELAAHTGQIFSRLRGFVAKYGADYRPSLFESLLLVAASVFQQRGVAIAVYEAAIGGANDATSFLPAVLSVVASVSLDHENELGGTIEAIARDKAGIAPPGTVLVLGAGIPARAGSAVRDECRRRGVRCVPADDTAFEVVSSGARGQLVRLTHPGGTHVLSLPLVGSHQVRNCATVWEVVRLLHESGTIASLDAIRGVERTRLRGRFELIDGSPSWLLDVAHNPSSVEALLATVFRFFPRERVAVVLGVTDPHDYCGIVRLVSERDIPVGVCEGFTRAIPVDRMAAVIPTGARLIGRFGNPAEALDHLIGAKAYHDMTVLVTGSLLLVGQWRYELIRRGLLAGDES